MKKLGSFLARFGIGLIVNLFAVVSLVLNVWEFVKMLVVRIVVKLPDIFTTMLGIFTALYTIYCIFTPDINSVGTKIFIIVMLFIVVGLLIRFSEFAINIVSAILLFIVSILDASYIIGFMRDSIFKLVDRYLNYCDGDLTFFERIYVFGVCYVLNFFRKAFQAIGRITSIVIYPLFAAVSGWAGYWLFFIDEEAPALWSLDWWMSVAVIALLVGAGIYLAYLVNEVTTESAEDSDFGLFTVFEVYSDTFRNFSKGYQNKSNNMHFETEEPKPTNEYFSLFASITSLEELKRTYKKLAKEVHPDVSNLPSDVACQKMADLNEAYKYFQNKF